MRRITNDRLGPRTPVRRPVSLIFLLLRTRIAPRGALPERPIANDFYGTIGTPRFSLTYRKFPINPQPRARGV